MLCHYNSFPGPGANQKWSKHGFHGYIDCYGLERHGAAISVKLSENSAERRTLTVNGEWLFMAG